MCVVDFFGGIGVFMNNVFKMVVVLVVGFVIGIVYVVDILKGKELVELYNCVVCYGV